MTDQQASSIYDILISECGASEEWRSNFIHAVTTGATEYRFQGRLGFGGKCWVERTGVRVSCYPEDRNDAREAMIAEANRQLAILWHGGSFIERIVAKPEILDDLRNRIENETAEDWKDE